MADTDNRPPIPPKSSSESCQFPTRLFSKPDASRFFPHVASVSPPARGPDSPSKPRFASRVTLDTCLLERASNGLQLQMLLWLLL